MFLQARTAVLAAPATETAALESRFPQHFLLRVYVRCRLRPEPGCTLLADLP